MNHTQATLGGLDCLMIDFLPPGKRPDLLVVLCHGFGAPGTDLAPFGQELVSAQPELADRTRFLFPAAPLEPREFADYGGRAWWKIDLQARIEAMARGEIDMLRRDKPAGLAEASLMLQTAAIEALAMFQIDPSRLVMGGFSQGAMAACDAALRMPQKPLGLAMLSGTLLSEDLWRTLAEQRGPLDVLQSHGMRDPILPFQAAEWLCDLFRTAGSTVEFLPFPGDHTIPFHVVARLAEWLCERAGADAV